jgi:hypothetical protein
VYVVLVVLVVVVIVVVVAVIDWYSLQVLVTLRVQKELVKLDHQ